MRSCDALTCILNIIGGQLLERWPPTFVEKLFGTFDFSYKDRIEMGTFLYGNVRDTNLVYNAVRQRLGSDPKHHDHMCRWLADIASGKYDDRYYYFDVMLADWCFLGGALNAKRWPSQRLSFEGGRLVAFGRPPSQAWSRPSQSVGPSGSLPAPSTSAKPRRRRFAVPKADLAVLDESPASDPRGEGRELAAEVERVLALVSPSMAARVTRMHDDEAAALSAGGDPRSVATARGRLSSCRRA